MSANREVDYDWQHEFHHGSHYGVAWIGFIVLLGVSVIANLAVYTLMRLSPKLNQSSASVILRYLSMEGALFSLSCLIQCALNVSIGHYFGADTNCQIQAVTHLFFVLSSGLTLCCIAYNTERKVNNHPVLTSRQVMIFHLFSFAWSALISILSAIVLADARVMPGALYCLISLDELASGLLFYVPGVGFILIFLVHRYYLIYVKVTQDAAVVSRQFKHNAEGIRLRQIASVKKMVLIVITYVVCASPLLLLTLYERIANTDAPAEAYIWAGYMIHVNSLVNCTLYVWMNTFTRKAMCDMLGIGNSKVRVVLSSIQTIRSGPVKTIKSVQTPRATSVKSSSDSARFTSPRTMNFSPASTTRLETADHAFMPPQNPSIQPATTDRSRRNVTKKLAPYQSSESLVSVVRSQSHVAPDTYRAKQQVLLPPGFVTTPKSQVVNSGLTPQQNYSSSSESQFHFASTIELTTSSPSHSPPDSPVTPVKAQQP